MVGRGKVSGRAHHVWSLVQVEVVEARAPLVMLVAVLQPTVCLEAERGGLERSRRAEQALGLGLVQGRQWVLLQWGCLHLNSKPTSRAPSCPG